MEIHGKESFLAATSDKEKLAIVRQVFSVHLALRLLGNEKLVIHRFLPLLAKDNLSELIKKCNELVELPQFKFLVTNSSGCAMDEVNTAFLSEVKNPT